MEKRPSRSIISFLPNRASFSHLQHHRPYSPGRETAKLRPLHGKGFSGPMVSIVPMEARLRKHKNAGGFETTPASQEPTSPKVTCMGQIKLKKMARPAAARRKNSNKPRPLDRGEKKPSFIIRKIKMFRRKAKVAAGRGSTSSTDAAAAADCGARRPQPAVPPVRAPLLGQMRRFASGRESLGDFDWRKVESPGAFDGEEGSDEEEVIIPHSAPIMVGGGGVVEPRKEVNLWKRRTLAPPVPLQL